MLYPNTIYHCYNQTNNSEYLFREAEDYALFTEKIRKHLLPVLDILCYCLMPTHFHIQYLPKGHGLNAATGGQQQIHAALRIMLSSYVRAYNLRYDRRGSLLRAKTKHKPAYTDFIPNDWDLKEEIPFTQFIPYIQVCFRYIHRNPSEAGLVDSPELWKYSSAPDFAGLRDNGICNYQLVERILGIKRLGD